MLKLLLLLVGMTHSFIANPSFEFWKGDTMPWCWKRYSGTSYTTPVPSDIALDGSYSVNLTRTADGKTRRIYNYLSKSFYDTLYLSFYTYGPGSLDLAIKIYDVDHGDYYYDQFSNQWIYGSYRHRYYTSNDYKWTKHTVTIVPVPPDVYNPMLIELLEKNNDFDLLLIDSFYVTVKFPERKVKSFGMWHNLFWASNDCNHRNLWEHNSINDKAKALLDTIYWIGLEVGDTQTFYIEGYLHTYECTEPYLITDICGGHYIKMNYAKLDSIIKLWKTRYPKMWVGVDLSTSHWDTAYDDHWRGTIKPYHVCERFYQPSLLAAYLEAFLSHLKAKGVPVKFISVGNEWYKAFRPEYCNLPYDFIKKLLLVPLERIHDIYPDAYYTHSYVIEKPGIDSIIAWLAPYKKWMAFHYGIDYEYDDNYYEDVFGSARFYASEYSRYSKWDYVWHKWGDNVFKVWDELNHSLISPPFSFDSIHGLIGDYGHQTIQVMNYLRAAAWGMDMAGPNAFIYFQRIPYAIDYNGNTLIGYYAYKAMAGAKLTGATIDSCDIDWIHGVFKESYVDRDGKRHWWFINLTPYAQYIPTGMQPDAKTLTMVHVGLIAEGYVPWDSTTVIIKPSYISLHKYEIRHYWEN